MELGMKITCKELESVSRVSPASTDRRASP